MLLATAFAIENPNITFEAIEATEFMALARQHAVMGVPRTVVNGSGAVDGALPEAAFLQAVLENAQPVAE